MDSEEENISEIVKETIESLLTRLEQINYNAFRVVNADMIDLTSDSDLSSTSSSSSDEETDDEIEEEKDLDETILLKKAPKTKGELDLINLPPIERLQIHVEPAQLFHIGRIASIIEKLVIVQSFKNMPAINLDSVLFLRDGLPLGHVFDVFGPVAEPLYSIRFNSVDEIKERQANVDMPVYIAPDYQAPVTDYVFAEQLKQMKGSDASWEHDNEPPEHALDYSDDEEERLAKCKQRSKRSLNILPAQTIALKPPT